MKSHAVRSSSLARIVALASCFALSAQLSGCAPEGDASLAAQPLTVAASEATRARSDLRSWTVARSADGLVIEGLAAGGAVRERASIRLEGGRPVAMERTWFDASGAVLEAVSASPDVEVPAPEGVCGECIRDVQGALAEALAPAPSEGTARSAQALTSVTASPGDYDIVPSTGTVLTSGGSTTTAIRSAITRNECWSCGGTVVTICDASLFGLCLWSHGECRASGDASAQCLGSLSDR